MQDQDRHIETLDDFVQPLARFLGRDNAEHLLSDHDSWRPPTNIRATDDRFVLEIELPGFRSDDVTINVEDGILNIACAREITTEEAGLIRRERRVGPFKRHFRLPDDALANELSIRLQDGVLYIEMPRSR